MSMWLQPSPCPDTTKLFSGEGQKNLVDGRAHGEVRSNTGKCKPFHQHDDGLVALLSCEGPSGVLLGVRRHCRDQIPRQTAPIWQDRRIIPA